MEGCGGPLQEGVIVVRGTVPVVSLTLALHLLS